MRLLPCMTLLCLLGHAVGTDVQTTRHEPPLPREGPLAFRERATALSQQILRDSWHRISPAVTRKSEQQEGQSEAQSSRHINEEHQAAETNAHEERGTHVHSSRDLNEEHHEAGIDAHSSLDPHESQQEVVGSEADSVPELHQAAEPEHTIEQWRRYCSKRMQLTEQYWEDKKDEEDVFIRQEGDGWTHSNRFCGDNEMETAVDELWRKERESSASTTGDDESSTNLTDSVGELHMSRWDLSKMPPFREWILMVERINRWIRKRTAEMLVKADIDRMQKSVKLYLRSQNVKSSLVLMTSEVIKEESEDLTRKVLNKLSCALWGSALYPRTCLLTRGREEPGVQGCLKKGIFGHSFAFRDRQLLSKALQDELNKLGFTMCGQRTKSVLKDMFLYLVDMTLRHKRYGLSFKFDETGKETGELQHIRIRMLTDATTFNVVKAIKGVMHEVWRYYVRDPKRVIVHLMVLHAAWSQAKMLKAQAGFLAQGSKRMNLASIQSILKAGKALTGNQ